MAFNKCKLTNEGENVDWDMLSVCSRSRKFVKWSLVQRRDALHMKTKTKKMLAVTDKLLVRLQNSTQRSIKGATLTSGTIYRLFSRTFFDRWCELFQKAKLKFGQTSVSFEDFARMLFKKWNFSGYTSFNPLSLIFNYL